MKNFDHYLKKVEKFFKKGEMLFSDEHNAQKDWQFLASFFVLIFICVIIIDGYIFYKADQGELFNAEPAAPEQVVTFNRTILQQTNQYYDTLEQNFTTQKSAAPDASIIDPAR